MFATLSSSEIYDHLTLCALSMPLMVFKSITRAENHSIKQLFGVQIVT